MSVNPDVDLAPLDMGIWSEDGTVWLPKQLFPTRNDAKRFAVAEMDHCWIDVRVRTKWMKHAPTSPLDDYGYHFAEPGEPGAFECWEVR